MLAALPTYVLGLSLSSDCATAVYYLVASARATLGPIFSPADKLVLRSLLALLDVPGVKAGPFRAVSRPVVKYPHCRDEHDPYSTGDQSGHRSVVRDVPGSASCIGTAMVNGPLLQVAS